MFFLPCDQVATVVGFQQRHINKMRYPTFQLEFS
jgi:hypothetical protein